ncbi:MAG TPA: hypothetical protein VIF57_24645 [Polyangia bacterium]|jgi:hypothetical protein
MAASAALLLAAAVADSGLRVETGTPAALCPDIAEVRQAVAERLNIEGEGEWLASYDLVHRPQRESEDVVRLELRDPAGRLRLRRELPRSGASCVALAQAVAMVLETYFRHPGEPIEEGRAPAAAPVTTSAPAARDEAREPAPPGTGLAAALLGSWSVAPASPAVAASVSYGGRARWAVGVDGAWMTREQARAIDLQPGQGTGFLRSGLVHVWGAIRLRAPRPVELLVGPELSLGIDHMRTVDVSEGRENVRAAFGAGARGELRLWMASRATLSFVVAVDYCPRAWAGRFEIEGVSAEPFPPPEARLLLGAGIGLLAFP